MGQEYLSLSSNPDRADLATAAAEPLRAVFESRRAFTGTLGSREQEIMRLLWLLGEGSVQEVAERLSTNLAYTTVMTILDRLFKKGLLDRKKKDRAFVYIPAITASELERTRVTQIVSRLFSQAGARPDLLLSSLVDAVDRYDSTLLDQLEEKVRLARERLCKEPEREAL